MRVDTGHHFLVLERLRHVINGPRLEPPDLVVRTDESGHEDDRQGRPLGFQPAARLEPVHAGHHHVEQDEVRHGEAYLLQSALAGGRNENLDTAPAEVLAEHVEIARGVVDDEYGAQIRPLGA